MLNRFMAAAGILALLVGFFMLMSPVSRIPLLDANRKVLVETNRGGACAGIVYADTRGAGSYQAMASCMAENERPDEIDHLAVTPAFCSQVAAAVGITTTECEEIMKGRQYWPMKDGRLTSSWNKRFPYPGEVLTYVPDSDSRVGDREGFTR